MGRRRKRRSGEIDQRIDLRQEARPCFEQLLEIARQRLVARVLRVFEEPLTEALNGADRRPEVVAQIPPKIGEILMHGSRIEQP